MSSSAVKVAVTGAAGQISYSLLFRIASGSFLGPNQSIDLSLLEIPQAMDALKGVVMELEDCAFPLINSISISDKADEAFNDIDYAFLVGARPRGPGMERKDLLEANAAIFSGQGKALDTAAKKTVKVIVVGNPANTNALIAQSNAPSISPDQFSAMTRLDHNRAISLLANKVQKHNTLIDKVIIWGNHSATQYPDLHSAQIDGTDALRKIDQQWYRNDFIPAVQQRGAAIISARGSSSAASAASAAIDHMRDWVHGNNWTSMAIRATENSYGVSGDIFFSFPVSCQNQQWKIIDGIEINQYSSEQIKKTENELLEEREAISHLLK